MHHSRIYSTVPSHDGARISLQALSRRVLGRRTFGKPCERSAQLYQGQRIALAIGAQIIECVAA